MLDYLSPFDQRAGGSEEKPSLKQRLTNLSRNVRGSITGIGQVVQLVWTTNPRLTISLGIVTFLQASTPAILIYLNKLLLDAVVQAIKHGHVTDQDIRTLLILVALQLGVNILASLLAKVASTCQQMLQTATANRVQYMIMAHASTLDLALFEQSSFYDILQQSRQEAAYRPVIMIASTFNLIRNLLVFLSMIALLVQLQWFLAVIALLAPIPTFISNARYSWQGYQLKLKQMPASRMMAYLSNLLTTDTFHKEIQVFRLSSFFLERFNHLATRFYEEGRSLLVKQSLGDFLWRLLSILSSGGIYLYVAFRAIYGFITLGDLVLYAQAVTSVQANFETLLEEVSSMYEHSLYLKAFFDLLAIKPQMQKPEHPVPMSRPFQQGIEFHNVTYTYEGAKHPALHNVSFTIQPGETVALVGRNGAGKTTLVKLLARLYDPQEGKIVLNGHDIREYDPAELHEEMGILFQDYVTYYLMAQENIGVGKVAEIDNRNLIAMAAAKSGADEVIDKLPEGYETMLGHWFGNGHQLSCGEWQKVALARAFMREAQLFILDEPTAALDAQAEYNLFMRIRELARDHTTIFISHRFSTVRLADRILVMEDGEIIEQGNHEELLKQDGYYAQLFNLQAASYR